MSAENEAAISSRVKIGGASSKSSALPGRRSKKAKDYHHSDCPNNIKNLNKRSRTASGMENTGKVKKQIALQRFMSSKIEMSMERETVDGAARTKTRIR